MPLHNTPPAFIEQYRGLSAGACHLAYFKRPHMSTNFDKAFAAIVGVEGGYVNDPKDPGGATNFGISSRAYPNVDVRSLDLASAKEIYARDYWAPIHGDELPWPLSLFLFDAAVNHGAGTAVTLLQKSLNVPQDGSMGPRTVKAAGSQDAREVCSMFMANRALRYTGTRNFDIDGRGWFKRLFKIAMEAI